MSKTKTVNLTGVETKVDFDRPFAYVECSNLSDGDILMSTKSNFERGDDDVTIVKSGSTATIGDIGTPSIKTVYLNGSGEVQLVGKGYAQSSFKRGEKGGDKPTPTEFDMSNIKAYFDVSGIDAENKIWTNAISEGGNITFAEGSIVDESLMIPGDNYGLFPLAQNPEVVYLVVKKPIVENDMCFFSQGSTANNHGYGLEIYSGTDGHSYGVDVFQRPYITIDVDVSKWHLFTVIRDWTNPSFLLCFCDAKYCGKLPTYNSYYTGNMYLNTSFRSSTIYYMCKNPSYFKLIAAGGLPPENYINTVTNNMDWLMKNVVNPANEEV